MKSCELFSYTIVMKNGIKYNVKADISINDLMKMLLPKYKDDVQITCFPVADIPNKAVAIIGSEVSSIEYAVN